MNGASLSAYVALSWLWRCDSIRIVDYLETNLQSYTSVLCSMLGCKENSLCTEDSVSLSDAT